MFQLRLVEQADADLQHRYDALNEQAEAEERDGGMSVRTEEALWEIEAAYEARAMDGHSLADEEAFNTTVCPKHPGTTLDFRYPCDVCRIESERIAEWVQRATEGRLPAKQYL